MPKRYSKKRQAIIDCLKSTDAHPSAEWIYSALKPRFPDLSLATVYRNLGELIEKGEVRTLGVIAGRERFDGRTDSHAHAVCRLCGKIMDLAIDPAIDSQTSSLADGFEVEYSSLEYVGLCAECKKR